MNITPELLGLNDAMEKQAFKQVVATASKLLPKMFKGVSSTGKTPALTRALQSEAIAPVANKVYQRTADQVRHIAEMEARRGGDMASLTDKIQAPLANRLETASDALAKSDINAWSNIYNRAPIQHANGSTMRAGRYMPTSYMEAAPGAEKLEAAQNMIYDATRNSTQVTQGGPFRSILGN